MAAHWRISQGLHWAAWSALTDVTSPSIAVITVATTSPSPPPPDAPPDARERRLLRSRLESEPRSVLGSREQRAGSEVPGPTLPGGGRQASRQEGQETWASLQTAGEARPAVGQNRPEHASQGDGFAGVTEASRLQMEFILKEESQQDGDQEATEPEQRLGSRHPHPTPGRWPHGTHSPEPLCFWGQSGRHGGRGGAPSSVSFQMCSPAGSFVPGRREVESHLSKRQLCAVGRAAWPVLGLAYRVYSGVDVLRPLPSPSHPQAPGAPVRDGLLRLWVWLRLPLLGSDGSGCPAVCPNSSE